MHSLHKECKKLGIYFLVTPHDLWGLRFIQEELGLRDMKIGSGGWQLLDNVDPSKNLFISLGMHRVEAVTNMISDLISRTGFNTILHCISEYPCLPKNAQLGFIRWLIEQTKSIPGIQIGYSDHTKGTALALATVGMGVQVIEKHLTLATEVPDRQDTFVSLDPAQFARFVYNIREIELGMGPRPEELRIITEGERRTMEWLETREQGLDN